MLNLPTPRPQTSHVTVRFEDGAHSFVLPQGATLTDLADTIGALGAQHDGDPLSIDVEFNTQGTTPTVQSLPRDQLFH